MRAFATHQRRRPMGARARREGETGKSPGIAPYGCGACQAALRCESAAIRTSRAQHAPPMTVNEERHGSIPIYLLYEDDLEQWRSGAGRVDSQLERGQLFQGRARQTAGAPGRAGRPAAVIVGLGRRNPREELSCWAAAAIPGSAAGRRLSPGRGAAGPLGDAVRVRLGVRAVQVRTLSAREPAASGAAASACPRPTPQKSRD